MIITYNPDGSRLVLPTVSEDSIKGFFEDYRFLSNFHLIPVMVRGIEYPSSEHAYMAQKTQDRIVQREISLLSTPNAAKKFGRLVELRPDWEYYRVLAMQRVLFAKFNQNKELGNLLLQTGEKYLEETNYWKDSFWGVCEGKGYNFLGKCLMIVRGQIC